MSDKQKFMKMTAGREIDWEIAKIMDVSEEHFNFAYEAGNFNYSSLLEDAWKVAEKFPIVNVRYVEIFEGFPSYTVEMPTESGTTEFQCKSFPLAICMCALFTYQRNLEEEFE